MKMDLAEGKTQGDGATMSVQGESKTCKTCGMEIPAKAKKCPFCRLWQRWFFHPAVLISVVAIPIFAGYGMLMDHLSTFTKGEPFQVYADQIVVVESKLEFGRDQDGPIVAVVGRFRNDSSVDWKDVRLQAEFFNAQDALIDVNQEIEYRCPSLPAGQEIGFKVSFSRQFPEKEYVRHSVRVLSAKDVRARLF
jgi:hypothetical protein